MAGHIRTENSRQPLTERFVIWTNQGLEALWLLAVVLIPLIFLPRDYLLSEAELAYVDIPKTALLRTLAALMAILWLLELSLQARFPFGGGIFERTPRLRVGKWLAELMVWLRGQPSRWLMLAVVLYLVSTLLSTALSASFHVSMWGLIPGQDTYPAYTVICYILLFTVVATHLRVRAQLDRLLGAIVLMGALAGCYAVLQHFGYDVFGLLNKPNGFIHSTMGNQIPAGAVLLMTIAVSLLAAAISLETPVARRRFWSKTALWTLILALQLLATVYVAARGPWVGTAVALVGFLGLLAIFAGWRMAARGALVLTAAVVVTTAVLFGPPELGREKTGPAGIDLLALVFPESEVPELAGRITSVGREVAGGGLSSRVEIWKTSWRIIEHTPWVDLDTLRLSYLRPLIGYGPDLFKYTYLLERRPLGEQRLLVSNRFAHNFFVHNTVELGFLGLLTSIGLFVALFAVGGYQLLLRRNQYSDIQKAMLAGLMAIAAGRLVEQSVGVAAVSDFTVFWVLLALFVALPTVMQAPQPASELVHSSPRRQPSNGAGTYVKDRIDLGRFGWRLALVACLIFGIGALTWVKSLNYPLAAVEARRGYQQLVGNNLPGAMAPLDRAIALAPDVPVYHNLRAAVFRGYRRQDSAAKEPGCARSIEATPYHSCLAREEYLSNREAAMQRPLEWRPRLTEAESAWSLALVERDPDMASEATRLFRLAAELDPQDWFKWHRLAAAQIQRNQPEAALAPLEKSLAILDGVHRSANTLMLRGMAYRELGQLDRALRDFDRSISISPSLADSYSNRGALYSDLGQYQRAIEDLDEAIKLNPELSMAYNNRGNAYGNLDQVTRAIQDFDEAIRLDPMLSLAYYNRALAFTLAGGDSKAERDAQRAVQLGSDPVSLNQAMERIKQGR